MDYDEIRKTIENITRENYGDFIKAIVSFEKGIDDKKVLDKIYDEYMKNDNFNLLNDNFDNLINGFTEPEESKENEKRSKNIDNKSVNSKKNVDNFLDRTNKFSKDNDVSKENISKNNEIEF